MKRLAFLILFSVLIVSNSFAQFTWQKTIQLPTNYLIGDIHTLNVFGNSFLFIDMNEQVFMYREGDDELTKLNPEDCYPGFKLQPIEIFHLPDGSIFLVNAGLPGYRFSANGSCLGIVEKDFAPAYHNQIEVDENGNIYTLTTGTQRSVILNIHDQTGKPIDTLKLNKSKFPEFDNRYKGGGMIIHDQIIYYIFSSGGTIQSFDLKSEEHLNQITFKPDYKPVISEDFPPNPYEAIKKLRDIMENHYVVMEMFRISENEAVIQTQFQQEGKNKYGLHKVSLVDKEISLLTMMDTPFYYAGSGRGYKIVDTRLDDKDAINPVIEVFSFTE